MSDIASQRDDLTIREAKDVHDHYHPQKGCPWCTSKLIENAVYALDMLERHSVVDNDRDGNYRVEYATWREVRDVLRDAALAAIGPIPLEETFWEDWWRNWHLYGTVYAINQSEPQVIEANRLTVHDGPCLGLDKDRLRRAVEVIVMTPYSLGAEADLEMDEVDWMTEVLTREYYKNQAVDEVTR